MSNYDLNETETGGSYDAKGQHHPDPKNLAILFGAIYFAAAVSALIIALTIGVQI